MSLRIIGGRTIHNSDGTTETDQPRVSGLDFEPNSTLVDTKHMQEYLDNGWPIVPIAKLAAKLGIKQVFTDKNGEGRMEHFLGRHPSQESLQVIIDAALDARKLPDVTLCSSDQGTGTLMSFAAANTLGQAGLDALRTAGYVVRVPEIDLEMGHHGRVSVFPNPNEEFLADLALYTGVEIVDNRAAHSSKYQPPVETSQKIFPPQVAVNPLAHRAA